MENPISFAIIAGAALLFGSRTVRELGFQSETIFRRVFLAGRYAGPDLDVVFIPRANLNLADFKAFGVGHKHDWLLFECLERAGFDGDRNRRLLDDHAAFDK